MTETKTGLLQDAVQFEGTYRYTPSMAEATWRLKNHNKGRGFYQGGLYLYPNVELSKEASEALSERGSMGSEISKSSEGPGHTIGNKKSATTKEAERVWLEIQPDLKKFISLLAPNQKQKCVEWSSNYNQMSVELADTFLNLDLQIGVNGFGIYVSVIRSYRLGTGPFEYPGDMSQYPSLEGLDTLTYETPPRIVSQNKINIVLAASNNKGEVRQNLLKVEAFNLDLFLDQNYEEEVAEAIRSFSSLFKDRRGLKGKIALLHGPVGTGKSTIIRGLCREAYLDGFSVVLIENPLLFLTNGGYQELISEREDPLFMICEDSAEIFATDLREANSDLFSRIANLTDGMVGEFRPRDIILFSSNCKIDKLDEAITRPGRCLANIYVGNLSRKKALDFLREKGIENPHIDGSSISLASLFDQINENKMITVKQKATEMGFGKG